MKNMKTKKMYSLICGILLFTTAYSQSKIDSLYDVLQGEWIWYECYYFGETYSPPENLSRIIIFSYNNSDSITYKTFRNDTLIDEGKTMLKDVSLPNCLITNDVIFGGDTINGDYYTKHRVTFVNDSIIWLTVNDGKSAPVFKYKKKGIINNIGEHRDIKGYDKKNIVYSDETILLNIDRLDISTNLVFKLINIQGSIIYQKRLNGNKCINIGNIPSGIYLGVLYSDNHLLYSEKIIIY